MDCTVVIPTRGRPGLLAMTINSVREQSDPPEAVVVVVDGPDEPSADLAGSMGCKIVRHAAPRGAGAARNSGVHAATTNWVAFLDDDDLWHPDWLRAAQAYISARPDVVALNAGYWTFGDASGVDLRANDLAGCLALLPTQAGDMGYLQITGRSFDLLLERNRGVISTAVVRRDVLLEAGGFPEGMTCAEDWMMFINVARLAEWHVVPGRWSLVRRHSGNNTNTNPTNGVVSLAAISDVWRTQQAAPAHRTLVEYGETYRWHVQHTAWHALRHCRFDLAREAWKHGRQLLPRRVDRLYGYLPPQVTHRLGQFRGYCPASKFGDGYR